MKKKRTPQFGSFSLQLVLCSAAVCSMITGTLLAFIHPEAPAKASHPAAAGLTFAERVAYQRAIEEVYWRHRIWPKERPDPKPSLDVVMPQAQLQKKVEDYLRKSQALEDQWQRPINAEQLQAEMDCMARDTRQPAVLRELFEALGNDPAVIAECLARPILAGRLIADLSAQGQTLQVESPQNEDLLAMSAVTTLGQLVYTLPGIADTCTDGTWMATTTANAPLGREFHTAVWTGSEMIVWGGVNITGYLNTGGRYDPGTNSWTAIGTTGAPNARGYHTAVWTGSEMIVWGGEGLGPVLNTGGKYNPGTDSWTDTTVTNAPASRRYHTAVWTGSEMIVWGGTDGSNYLNTGGRYDPGTDSWTATAGVRIGRQDHTAVWTGSEMIVWGGKGIRPVLNTGGRYNPSTDSWTNTIVTNAPASRRYHTAVWTGNEMIVWGGMGSAVFNTGGRYDPGTDSWIATTTTSAPTARYYQTAVWTGSEMIVWGGSAGTSVLNTGGRYNPGTDSWTATSSTGAPAGREFHTAVWTGSQMTVWGGWNGDHLNTGGRYCAQFTPPTPTPTGTPSATPRTAPTPRQRPTPASRP